KKLAEALRNDLGVEVLRKEPAAAVLRDTLAERAVGRGERRQPARPGVGERIAEAFRDAIREEREARAVSREQSAQILVGIGAVNEVRSGHAPAGQQLAIQIAD